MTTRTGSGVKHHSDPVLANITLNLQRLKRQASPPAAPYHDHQFRWRLQLHQPDRGRHLPDFRGRPARRHHHPTFRPGVQDQPSAGQDLTGENFGDQPGKSRAASSVSATSPLSVQCSGQTGLPPHSAAKWPVRTESGVTLVDGIGTSPKHLAAGLAPRVQWANFPPRRWTRGASPAAKCISDGSASPLRLHCALPVVNEKSCL